MERGVQAFGPIGDSRPDLWIVGDGDVEAAQLHAEACGFRIAEKLSLAKAGALLRNERSVPLVLIEIGDLFLEEAAEVLEQLDLRAMDGRTPVIVSCTPSTLDAVVARIAAPYATLLCNPSPADRIFALHAATTHVAGVTEAEHAAEAQQLLVLTEEISRIARVIAELPKDGSKGSVSDGLVGYRGPPGRPSVKVEAGDIRTLIRWRRRRDAAFPGDLFADPAWDMMLDLAAAHLEGAEVAVSSLCIAAAVPPTTALRWIKTLTDAGMFERVADPYDRRRIYIRLSDQVADAVLGFLGQVKGTGGALI